MSDDTPQITEEEATTAARLFDIRRLIGGLFVVYGLIVTVVGFVDGEAEESKAAGIDINLWTGLAMLLFGVGMLAWQRVRPAEAPKPADE